MTAEIGDLLVHIKESHIQFTEGLRVAQGEAEAFHTNVIKGAALAVAAIGTLAIAGFSFLANEINKTADELESMIKTANKLSIGVSQFQELAYAAHLSGVSVETLTVGLKFMEKTVGLAALGTGQAGTALHALNLSAQELIQLTPDQQYIKISEALKGVSNETERAALATKIFGRGGVEQMNVLNANIKGLEDQFRSLGLEMSNSQIQVITSFETSKKKLTAIWSGFKEQVTADVAPAFTQIIESISKSIEEMGGMRELAKSVAIALVTGFGEVYSAVKMVVDSVKELEELLTKLNPGASIGALGDKVGNAWDSNMPGLDGKHHVNGGGGNAGATAGLTALGAGNPFQSIIDNLRNITPELTSFIQPIRTAADALKEMALAANFSKNSLEGMVESLGKSELGRILGLDQKKDAEQAHSSQFDDITKAIYRKFQMEQHPGEFHGSMETVKSFSQLFEKLNDIISDENHITINGPNKSTAGMAGVVNELHKLVDSQANKDVHVKITVAYDKQGVLKAIVESPAAKDATAQVMRDLTSTEAQAYGVK